MQSDQIQSGMNEEDLMEFFKIDGKSLQDRESLPFGECPECGANTLVYELKLCTSCDTELDIEEYEHTQYCEYLAQKSD